jgi:hypothetical protein
VRRKKIRAVNGPSRIRRRAQAPRGDPDRSSLKSL